jgi:hypothetical protein
MFTAPIVLMRVVAWALLIHHSISPLVTVAARHGGDGMRPQAEEEGSGKK